MTGHPIFDLVVPLLFGLSCGIAIEQIRGYVRGRRLRRITSRLLGW